MPLTSPGGESLFAGMDRETLLALQMVAHIAVIAGIGLVCRQLGGWLAAVIGVVWWVVWPSAWHAVTFPYYYYWPIPFTVGLANLWARRGTRTLWTLPLLVVWAQFRMTAVGTFAVMPRWAVGVAAWGLTIALLAGGQGRTQVWHDLYIGIGTRPNSHGIVHQDGHAIAFAATRGVGFKAPAYESVLRAEYLRIVAADPALIARNTVLNTVDAARGWSFWGGPVWCWVPLVTLWAAWRDRGVYRALTLVWLAQCATLGFVGRPQESYLWETAGLFVVLGAVGTARALYVLSEKWEPYFA